MTKNSIYISKKLKVLLPFNNSRNSKIQNLPLVLSISRNVENLGYILGPRLTEALAKQDEDTINNFYVEFVSILKKLRGAHRKFNPMYPNFPQQVIDMSEEELYLNALVHYWSFYLMDLGLVDDTWLPEYEEQERPLLNEKTKYDIIDIGNEEDFCKIFTQLASANTSISENDKQILNWFIKNYQDDIEDLLPNKIPNKEQLTYIASLLINSNSASAVTKFISTPTDVLRFAVALSDGDVSLAEPCKFISFSRKIRQLLLLLLESCSANLEEEMKKYSERWIRLGERLHPRQYKNSYPRAASAFFKIRGKAKIKTFNSRVEEAIAYGDNDSIISLLKSRPGEFARRLDHIIRTSNKPSEIVASFDRVADKVATPVLLQVQGHFRARNSSTVRPIFPKGNVAKVKLLDNDLPPISEVLSKRLVRSIDKKLINRFKEMDELGKVYIDPSLNEVLVPFSQRSASKSLKTLVRGSKIPLDGDYDTIRFFIWWKNGAGRTDIDLSGVIMDNNFGIMQTIAYYNLKDLAGHHSGDITNAPRGASEFIDISMNAVRDMGGRYIAMAINSYTTQPFCDLPECFAGWMGRKKANSGEIYEPKTVKNKIDVSSNSKICMPLLIDVVERKIIWMDMTLKSLPYSYNNVASNQTGISDTCKAMVSLGHKPTLYNLFKLHAKARGTLVKDEELADTKYVIDMIPEMTDEIMADYMK